MQDAPFLFSLFPRFPVSPFPRFSQLAIFALMQIDLLAIMAHPDDAELLCGGTLARMAAQGYRVGILDLSAGESG